MNPTPVETKSQEEEIPVTQVIPTPKSSVKSEFVSDPYDKKGTVEKCTKLYVRKSPSKSASSSYILDSGSIVNINLSKSTDDFYAIRISIDNTILKGYCMKKFISVES